MDKWEAITIIGMFIMAGITTIFGDNALGFIVAGVVSMLIIYN